MHVGYSITDSVEYTTLTITYTQSCVIIVTHIYKCKNQMKSDVEMKDYGNKSLHREMIVQSCVYKPESLCTEELRMIVL